MWWWVAGVKLEALGEAMAQVPSEVGVPVFAPTLIGLLQEAVAGLQFSSQVVLML